MQAGHDLRVQFIAFFTILRRECLREWQFTILAPLVTLVLYMVVFGPIIGEKVGAMGGVAYIDYIFPGLVMLAIVLNAYNSSALSLYLDKFLNAHQEWLTASVYARTVIAAMAVGCAVRSLILVLILSFIGLWMGLTPLPQHPFMALAAILVTALAFSLAGIINAMLANTFDQISFVPNLVLVPLTFTGGVFYDISLLSPSMQTASLLNPVFYMVDALRAGMTANNHLSYALDLSLVSALLVLIACLCWGMVKRGVGLRT